MDDENKAVLNIRNFGLNLYRIRNAHKITVERFAEMLDVSSRIIYDWEAGKKFPTFERAINIANILGVTLDSILC